MGTLDDARYILRTLRRPYEPSLMMIEACAALRMLRIYRAELNARVAKNGNLRYAYGEEMDELDEVAHAIAIAVRGSDWAAVWHGWTRPHQTAFAGHVRHRVTIVRVGQMAVVRGKQFRGGRVRVEDAFVVKINHDTATAWLTRAAANKQARWATMVREGRLPSIETDRGLTARRAMQRRRRRNRRDRPRNRRQWRRLRFLCRQLPMPPMGLTIFVSDRMARQISIRALEDLRR